MLSLSTRRRYFGKRRAHRCSGARRRGFRPGGHHSLAYDLSPSSQNGDCYMGGVNVDREDSGEVSEQCLDNKCYHAAGSENFVKVGTSILSFPARSPAWDGAWHIHAAP